MNGARIVHLTAADADAVEGYLALRAALWPMADAENRSEIAEILANDTWATFIARTAESAVAGFVEVRLREYADGARTSPVGFIEGWYVMPAARRQGVGRALVEACERWAQNRGCTEMASNALIENADGIAAHARLGYEEIERTVAFVKQLE